MEEDPDASESDAADQNTSPERLQALPLKSFVSRAPSALFLVLAVSLSSLGQQYVRGDARRKRAIDGTAALWQRYGRRRTLRLPRSQLRHEA